MSLVDHLEGAKLVPAERESHSQEIKVTHDRGGRIAQWIAFSLGTQRLRVRFSAFPTEFTYSVDVVEINRQQHCLVLCGLCKKLNHVDRTHLALQDSATKKKVTHDQVEPRLHVRVSILFSFIKHST